MTDTTHHAYSDDSNQGRYKGICVISLSSENAERLTLSLDTILSESNVSEFKWSKIKGARERFAADKMITRAVGGCLSDDLRIDVLIWNTEDSRHKIQGRDDIKNLHRMYYHLFKNVLQRRWPNELDWHLFPDNDSAMDWQSIKYYLDKKGIEIDRNKQLFDESDWPFTIVNEFNIKHISQVESHKQPLVQLADLFVGIGAFSHASFDRYSAWKISNPLDPQQTMMPFVTPLSNTSNTENERYKLLSQFDATCKGNKMGVSLMSSYGLVTKDPTKPINFWLYKPQHERDKAPTRKG